MFIPHKRNTGQKYSQWLLNNTGERSDAICSSKLKNGLVASAAEENALPSSLCGPGCCIISYGIAGVTGKGWRLNRVIFQLSLSPHQQEGICWGFLFSTSRRRASCISAHGVKRLTVPRAWVIAIRTSPTPAPAQKPEPSPTTGEQFGLTDVAPLLRTPESFGWEGPVKIN